MNDDDSQYLLSNFKKKKIDDDSQYLLSNFKKNKKEDSESFIQKHLLNPFKGAKGKNSLETAGNLADLLINKPIEATGFPSFSRGVFQSGENLIRGVSNIPADIAEYSGHKINPLSISGLGQVYPIPKTDFPRSENVNPYIAEGAEAAGSLLGLGAINKIYQGTKAGLGALPYAKKIPEFAKNIVAGTATGAAISPDNRKLGAGLGAAASTAAEAIPAIIKAVQELKPNAFKAIQEGYDTKLKNLSSMFKSVEKDAEKAGIKKIKLPQSFFNELEEVGPQSKTFKRLVEKAKQGGYKELRKLNTELFKRGTKYSSSPFPSDVERAEDIFHARDTLNDTITNALKSIGLDESVTTLNKAKGGYKALQDTYHSHPTISKLVGPNRLVPSKSTVLYENSERMKNLKMNHPEIDKQLNYEKKLKIALGFGAGTTGLGTAYSIINKLYGD